MNVCCIRRAGRVTLLAAGAAALLGLVLWRWWASASPPAGPAAGAHETPPALKGVAALGRLEPATRVARLSATSMEGLCVRELRFREGDWVPAGEVVARLDTHPARVAGLAEAEARVGVAKARLELVRAGSRDGDIDARRAAVVRLQHVMDNADREYRRTARMRASGAVASAEHESRRMQRDAAVLELRQAEALLRSTAEVRGVDVKLAQAELRQAEAAAAAARAQVELAQVRAPFAGRVLKVHTWPGEKISDKGVCELADTQRMEVVAEVYENDVPRVKVGQPARVKVPALGVTLAGEVAQLGWMIGKKDVLNNDPVADTDARVVEVRVRLGSADAAKVAALTHLRVEVVIGAPPGGGDGIQ